jgi:flagellar biosynthesis protein FlhG
VGRVSRIFPIGGGKGGTGKTVLAANLGALLAKNGKKVVLVDLDLGGANLHTCLGIRNPKIGLNEFLNKTCKRLDQVVVPTVVPNLSLVTSANCSLEIANLFHAQKLKIIRAIKILPYDYILLDLGAGTAFNTLDFFLISNEGLFVFTPEPMSIENTARFIRAAYLRKVKQILKQGVFFEIVRGIIANLGNRDAAVKSSDVIEALTEKDPAKGKLLLEKLSEFRFKLILNQFQKGIDENLGEKIETVCSRHFHSEFQFLGNVSYDERVHDSVLSSRPYVTKYPYTPAAQNLKDIADKLTGKAQHASETYQGYHEKI